MSFNYEQLISYAAGELTAEQAENVRRQLAATPGGARTVELYRTVRDTLRHDDSVAPPAEVIARACALFRAPPSAASACWEALTRVVAELIYDSRPAGALAGLRGASVARQLSFRAPLADVDLQIERISENDCGVTGQITASPGTIAECVALLPRSGGDSIAGAVEPDGSFTLRAPCGVYDLMISVAADALVVPNLLME